MTKNSTRGKANPRPETPTPNMIGKTVELDCYGGHYSVKITKISRKGIYGRFKVRNERGEWSEENALGMFDKPKNILIFKPLSFSSLLRKK